MDVALHNVATCDVRNIVAKVDRLQRLAVFESAGRLGSFSAAADELGMFVHVEQHTSAGVDVKLNQRSEWRARNDSFVATEGLRVGARSKNVRFEISGDRANLVNMQLVVGYRARVRA